MPVYDIRQLKEEFVTPRHSSAFGSLITGERIELGLLRYTAGEGAKEHAHPQEQILLLLQGKARLAPAGKMGDPHSHPNEQWIYVLEGEFEFRIDGQTHRVGPGGLIFVPANKIHQGGATAAGDAVFFTCKDASHGLHGVRAGASLAARTAAPTRKRARRAALARRRSAGRRSAGRRAARRA